MIRKATVDYGTFFRLYQWSFSQYKTRYYKQTQYRFPASFLSDIAHYSQVAISDAVFVVVIATILTKLRLQLTRQYFLPIAIRMQTPRNVIRKIPENIWKLGFYTCTTIWSAYTVLLRHNHWFNDPLSVWNEWSPAAEIPWDVYCLYVIQCSFYLHSVYATIYLDPKRKDFSVMMTHHAITLALITFSYATKHYMEGALVLFCHDINDIFLELWKINSNWRRRAGNKFYQFHDRAAIISFILFVTSWFSNNFCALNIRQSIYRFLFRLYWYPLKVMYTSIYGPFVMLSPEHSTPFWLIFTLLLTGLLMLNIYWFALMIIGLYRHLIRQDLTEVSDTREYSTTRTSISEYIHTNVGKLSECS